MESNEDKLTVAEVGHRSQEKLDTLRQQHLEGIRRSNFTEGIDLTYNPDEERLRGLGITDAEQIKLGFNPKFRFKAVVRLVISHIIWMSSAHGEEKKPDDFAFNLHLLRKKKGQLSLLTYKEKMALLKRPSSRTDEEINILSEAFAKIKCLKAYDKNTHIGLGKSGELYCFGPNREVMRKGNPSTGVYLITSGEAASLKLHLDCLTLEPSLIPSSSILPGQLFGELTLLFGIPRTISVITMSKNIGEHETVHVVLRGVCSVIQRVDMIHGTNVKGVSVIPYIQKEETIPAGYFIRTHFLDVAHFRKGMAFNLGESWHNRVVMALNDVEILCIPNNVIEDYEGRDNTWEVIKDFIKTNLPEEESIYAEYKEKIIWLKHREKLREDVILHYKDPQNTNIRDIPISITHLLKREEIK